MINSLAAGINPGVYTSGLSVSFAGDANAAAASAIASLTVTDAPIVAKGTTLTLGGYALSLGTFTQARASAVAGDFVAMVNWGDGSAMQQVYVIADPLHPGTFDVVGGVHNYKTRSTTYTVTVTISTIARFGVAAGATTTYTNTIKTGSFGGGGE